MHLQELSERAMQIRARFAGLETKSGARPWTRAEVMQGLVVDVGDLMRLVMAKDGIRHVDDVDRKLAHELSDCFWSVLVLARMNDIDFESAFLRTMHDLDSKIGAQLDRSDTAAGCATDPDAALSLPSA